MVALGIDLFQPTQPPSLHSNNHEGAPQVGIELFYSKKGRAGTRIKWLFYLLRSPSLPQLTQDLGNHISDSAWFNYWIDSAANLGKDVVHTGLQLRMESPGVVENQATAADEAQNHLMIVKPLGMSPFQRFVSKRILTILILNSCLVLSKITLTFTLKSCTNSIFQTKNTTINFWFSLTLAIPINTSSLPFVLYRQGLALW
ncbi:hypothetical protein VP01_4475g1 [Puccinia sorghi]|uniref:Uncharacterized protein n=1 Tax=Puccinia sorghi TaxID=27349 RepID=A0A0L6UQ66_9BASI|nr:hypothetical protein VP01_4475g1 [Puccinia sorghi]